MIIDELPHILQGFWLNIRLAIYAGLIALVLGVVLAGFRVSPVPILRWIGASWVNVFRNTPLTLIIFFCLFGLSYQLHLNLSDNIPTNNFWLAVIGFSVYTASFVCEVMRAGINTVPPGQAEAARSLGLSFMQNLRLVVLPQALRAVIAPMGSVYIALVKNTTICVTIGVTTASQVNDTAGQMKSLLEIYADKIWLIFAVFAVGYMIITLPMGFLTSWAAKKWGVLR
ncbi:amino acid ABC transporter permease [Nocardioides sp.]|uniref:amino acid ABC transporter permease n=1 Tax=Nocardioides sp. TaxID=35761 RepID=UPI0039E28332